MTINFKRDESIRRILDAAMEVFASVGFAGARIDEIARQAGVNKAMIYYRIGDKKTLYAEVLHDIFSNFVERIEGKIEPHLPPEEKLRVYLRNLLSIFEAHPYIPRFMMWELASGGGNFPEVAALDLARLLGLLKKILKEGVEKEIFLETNPFIPQMMAIGTMAFYRASKPIRTRYQMVDQDLSNMDQAFSKDVAREIEELVIKAVKR
jgi:TetR/AcrR family transcriptional regulator